MLHIEFTEEAIKELRYERYNHPHPRVERKMEALLLKSEGLSHGMIGKIVGVSQKTLREYLYDYAKYGIEGLREVKFYQPESKLMEHKKTIEEVFREEPPATIKEAAARIFEITGIKRDVSRVGVFLKKNRVKTSENSTNTGKSRHRSAGWFFV